MCGFHFNIQYWISITWKCTTAHASATKHAFRTHPHKTVFPFLDVLFAPLQWCLCNCIFFSETQQQQGGESMSLSVSNFFFFYLIQWMADHLWTSVWWLAPFCRCLNNSCCLVDVYRGIALNLIFFCCHIWQWVSDHSIAAITPSIAKVKTEDMKKCRTDT